MYRQDRMSHGIFMYFVGILFALRHVPSAISCLTKAMEWQTRPTE